MSQAAKLLATEPELREELSKSILFAKLEAGLRKVTVDDEMLFVVEGDILMDEAELLIYANQREVVDRVRKLEEAADRAGMGSTTIVPPMDSVDTSPLSTVRMWLTVHTRDGDIVRWPRGGVLTYCVLENSFDSREEYVFVRDNMRQAAMDWESTCNIKFSHVTDADASDSRHPDGVLFPVRKWELQGKLIASAFYPDHPPSRRKLLIDPTYFTTDRNPVGVLRHEIGHILSFRHEHIRSGAPPACPDEPHYGGYALTVYDPQSVMHYFCGPINRGAMEITELDRWGAQRLYGPPQ